MSAPIPLDPVRRRLTKADLHWQLERQKHKLNEVFADNANLRTYISELREYIDEMLIEKEAERSAHRQTQAALLAEQRARADIERLLTRQQRRAAR